MMNLADDRDFWESHDTAKLVASLPDDEREDLTEHCARRGWTLEEGADELLEWAPDLSTAVREIVRPMIRAWRDPAARRELVELVEIGRKVLGEQDARDAALRLEAMRDEARQKQRLERELRAIRHRFAMRLAWIDRLGRRGVPIGLRAERSRRGPHRAVRRSAVASAGTLRTGTDPPSDPDPDPGDDPAAGGSASS